MIWVHNLCFSSSGGWEGGVKVETHYLLTTHTVAEGHLAGV